ncbi:MAG TPA: SDR family oxidoreductase [Terriglobales bacterium]|jgi:NAD(P)-dependent dehydrogenase (short-subunit alcohol dehydrogenase family)|nr:SDR family oxidoreductase [Terriglobales bacterium]
MENVVIVTGGARGIGAETCRLAAQRGYAVCVNYLRNASAAENLVKEIQTLGVKAIAIAADVAQEEDVVRMFEEVDRSLGLVTALVNNAGIVDRISRLDEMSADRLQRMFATNITGSFLCAREAVKRMSTRHGGSGGSIVNVSSAVSRLGGGGIYIDYAASKGAIDTMTLGLAREVADEGIRVNAVRPGLIYTEIHVSSGDPGRVDRLKDSIPMKRGGEAVEVARTILWLLSAEASYCTGTFLDVSGGR